MLSQKQLDTMTCNQPGCDCGKTPSMFFHSNCHPGVPTWCEYREGAIFVRCAECNKLVVAVAVAEEA
jgi:hypothetical protein